MDTSSSAARFYGRYGPTICILALLLMPVLLYAAKGAFDSNTNNPLDWLPKSFRATERLFEFVSQFGSDEILVVSWPGCTLSQQKLEQLAELLVKPVTTGDSPEPTVYFRRVFTGQRVLETFTSEPLNLTREQAIQRMRGWLVGPDGKTTCLVALIGERDGHSVVDRHAAVKLVHDSAAACGLDRDMIRVGGSTVNGVAIDNASQSGLVEMGLSSAVMGLLVAWICLRSLRLVVIIFFSAAFAWGISLAMVFFSGTNMDAVLIMMPALVFVLGVSGAVHLTNYYLDAVREDGWADAPSGAIARGWLPCALAAGTTAIGLGSLAISKVTPVSKFGVFSALGVMVALASLLVLWPAAIHWWTARGTRLAPGGSKGDSPRQPTAAWWQPCYHLSTRGYWLIFVLALLVLPGLSYGIWNIRTSVRLENLLPRRSHLIRSYAWIQDNIGPLVPVEIVLRFPAAEADDSLELLRRMEIVERLRQRVDRMQHVGGTVAASTFSPPIPDSGSARSII